MLHNEILPEDTCVHHVPHMQIAAKICWVGVCIIIALQCNVFVTMFAFYWSYFKEYHYTEIIMQSGVEMNIRAVFQCLVDIDELEQEKIVSLQVPVLVIDCFNPCLKCIPKSFEWFHRLNEYTNSSSNHPLLKNVLSSSSVSTCKTCFIVTGAVLPMSSPRYHPLTDLATSWLWGVR